MKKCFCDKCGETINYGGIDVHIEGKDTMNSTSYTHNIWLDLCEKCSKVLIEWLNIQSTPRAFKEKDAEK